MKKYYTVRFDDICPTMDWKQFERAKTLMHEYSIKPLIGVIPNNEDKDQMIDAEIGDFWNYIKELQNSGWEIALHGYTHVYNQDFPRTILCGRKHSEFAGNSYEDQFKRIINGKAILEQHGIKTDIFFAPAHTYDNNTLKALYAAGFKYISDGMSCYPYIQEGITCIPCRSSGIPGRFLGKYNVAVCHSSEWGRNKPNDYNELKRFCEQHKADLVDFKVLKRAKAKNAILQKIDERIFIFVLKIKNFIRR